MDIEIFLATPDLWAHRRAPQADYDAIQIGSQLENMVVTYSTLAISPAIFCLKFCTALFACCFAWSFIRDSIVGAPRPIALQA
jgi:hypothetical protein